MNKHIPILLRITTKPFFAHITKLCVTLNRSFFGTGIRLNPSQFVDLFEHFCAVGRGEVEDEFDDFSAEVFGVGVLTVV